jgi:hypothetical protein
LENEGITNTNGGFELAASASKYLDASHQSYHLHDKKGKLKNYSLTSYNELQKL